MDRQNQNEVEHEVATLSSGTSQAERFSEALDARYFQVDERSIRDLFDYSLELARRVPFYDIDSAQPLFEVWDKFLTPKNSPANWIDDEESFESAILRMKDSGSSPPQLALFLSFLKLFQQAQQGLNRITENHLVYYFREVLRLAPKKLVPDTALVSFALDEDSDEVLVPKGTLLQAGNDSLGNELVYSTSSDILLNHAAVQKVHSIYAALKKENQFHIDFAPIANSLDGFGKEFADKANSWPPFGNRGVIEYPEEFQIEVGFAVATDILKLRGGNRRIKLILSLPDRQKKSVANLKNKLSIQCHLTGAEGWIELPTTKLIPDKTGNLFCKLELSSTDPAVISHDAKLHGSKFEVDSPVLKVLAVHKNRSSIFDDYMELSNLRVTQLRIKVNVDDLDPESVENDWGPLSTDQAFLPFGPQPAIGNGIYVDDSEAKNKPLRDLAIRLDWLNLPDKGLKESYATWNQFLAKSSPSSFRVGITPKTLGIEKPEINLFKNRKTDRSKSVTRISHNELLGAACVKRSKAELNEQLNEKLVELKLSTNASNQPISAFGHAEFAQVQFQFAMTQAKGLAESLRTGIAPAQNKIIPVPPNPPYLPALKSIKLSYKSEICTPNNKVKNVISDSKTLDEKKMDILSPSRRDRIAKGSGVSRQDVDDTLGQTESMAIRLFKLDPFGASGNPVENFSAVSDSSLFPVFENEGYFYIGLSNATPPQSISILFEIARGSFDGMLTLQDPIQWSWLGKEGWQRFSDESVQDSTRFLRQSGVISFALPESATSDFDGLYWIRATLPNNVEAIGRVRNMFTQGCEAKLARPNVAKDHFENGLPAGSINSLKDSIKGVSEVTQPFPTFGGRATEDEHHFRIRTSERLRHKNRASTIWDYERLVLQEFPDVYRVECLPNLSRIDDQIQSCRGNILIVIVPNVRRDGAEPSLKPTATPAFCEQVLEMLSSRASPFVSIQVVNPVYQELRVNLGVKFKPGLSFEYGKQQLNMEITQFLSPWSFQDGKDVVFGGRIHESSLQAFVENRSYINFISDFHYEGAANHTVQSHRPDAVIVSAKEHNIYSSSH